MLPNLYSVKGIHPGAILKRELKKQNIKGVKLAKTIDEYPQTINAIINERRGINPKLSIKLGSFFGVDDDFFMLLQAAYEVEKLASSATQSLPAFTEKLRKSIFWDTEIEKIDWQKSRRAVIQRILERGNKSEIEALIEYYGIDTIRQEIQHITNVFSPAYRENVNTYISKLVS